jgi:hypothetical protein
MKPVPVIVSLVAATFLVVGTGYHFATRSPENGPAPLPGGATPGGNAGGIASTGAAGPSVGGEPAAGRRVLRAPRSVEQAEGELGISRSYLEEADRRADEVASRMGSDLSVLEDAGYDLHSRSAEDASRKLGLRLGVGAEVLGKLGGILAEDRASRTGSRMAAEEARLEHHRTLIGNDREAYVNYLALESMVSRGHPLSGKQGAFYKDYRQTLEGEGESGAPADDREWHEKPEVLDLMRGHLSPDQEAELQEFVDEQKAREQERQEAHARMRSGVIADRLGLDEAERKELHEYLRENPDASGREIGGILAPELRELLPPGL